VAEKGLPSPVDYFAEALICEGLPIFGRSVAGAHLKLIPSGALKHGHFKDGVSSFSYYGSSQQQPIFIDPMVNRLQLRKTIRSMRKQAAK
jgi:hypothetical protein